jgi:hypothetical protein
MPARANNRHRLKRFGPTRSTVSHASPTAITNHPNRGLAAAMIGAIRQILAMQSLELKDGCEPAPSLVNYKVLGFSHRFRGGT